MHIPRLVRTCQRVVKGETIMCTGVTFESYHDVWMQLHDDFILSHVIDLRPESGR